MLCKKCGFQNLQDAMYCSGCGAKLQNPSKGSIDKKYKLILGIIAAMMLFSAVMAIVSAGKGGGGDDAETTVATSNLIVPEDDSGKDEFPTDYRENPEESFYDYALIDGSFCDGQYIYVYMYDFESMYEPLPGGEYNAELIFLSIIIEGEYGVRSENFVEYLESVEEISGEGNMYSMVTTIDSGKQKKYTEEYYGVTMTDENGNDHVGFFSARCLYELYRLELAEDCTFYNRGEEVSFQQFTQMIEQEKPYTGDYVRVRINTNEEGKAVSLELPYNCKLDGHMWENEGYDLEDMYCTECYSAYYEEDGYSGIEDTETMYINNMIALGDRNGVVWTRSTRPVNYGFEFTNEDIPECWDTIDYSLGGHTPGVVIDNWGNEYMCGIYVTGGEQETYYFSVDLYGEYTAFTGTVGCPERSAAISEDVYKKSTAYTKYFEVYGDGVLLYTSPTIRYDYPPQDFTVDVTGVDRMTIVYPATKGPNEIATIYDGVVS